MDVVFLVKGVTNIINNVDSAVSSFADDFDFTFDGVNFTTLFVIAGVDFSITGIVAISIFAKSVSFVK